MTFRQVPLPVDGRDNDSSEDNDSQHLVMVTFELKQQSRKDEAETNRRVGSERNDVCL